MRSLFNRDMATGLLPLFDGYKTVGPDNTWHIKNPTPERPEPVCYILNPETCIKEQYDGIKNGTAVIKDWTVVGYSTDVEPPFKGPSDAAGQEYIGKEDL